MLIPAQSNVLTIVITGLVNISNIQLLTHTIYRIKIKQYRKER